MDIYYSLKVFGDWGKPFNAGIRINTFLNEDYPVFTNKGATLIYSSQGFKRGKDGYDIYYCNSVSDNLWTEPINLGYPVNTSEDDINYAPLTDESQVFFNLSLLNTKPGEIQGEEKDVFVKAAISNIDSTIKYENMTVNITDNANKNINDLAKVSTDGKFKMLLKKGDYTIKFLNKDSAIKIVNFFIPFLTRKDTIDMNVNFSHNVSPNAYEYNQSPSINIPNTQSEANSSGITDKELYKKKLLFQVTRKF
jgi:hypothetical protein